MRAPPSDDPGRGREWGVSFPRPPLIGEAGTPRRPGEQARQLTPHTAPSCRRLTAPVALLPAHILTLSTILATGAELLARTPLNRPSAAACHRPDMSDQVADRSGGRCPFLEIRLAGTTCHCPSARSLDRPGP